MSDDTHYYACYALGWATAPTLDEAIKKLVRSDFNTFKKTIARTRKDGLPGAYIWACKVHAPPELDYAIEWYMPQGVKLTEAQEVYVTYATREKISYWVGKKQKDESQESDTSGTENSAAAVSKA